MTQPTSTPGQPSDESSWDDVVEAVVAASRVLVAVAAQSLAGRSDEVTLPQYRLLVILTAQGPQRIVDLAINLDVNPSTATRLCDRLERKGLVDRQRMSSDRRAVQLVATSAGHELVRDVMDHRRVEIGRILASMTPDQHRQVAEGLRLFSEAAGDVPDRHWTVGWRPQ
ncbi:MarR family winged helix-turn-helix transcriptional regulator [Phytoactinopolyspora halophila]|uniref:MarR family winged helix-turn-helix transcriptional regulator n=1 Tax=Phytoactinopolyspora halophila TaxID=1981511 RepID=UPI001B8CFAF7|nr:MarR family transcriptional regulator [Phytoactinopolyspora halophila]